MDRVQCLTKVLFVNHERNIGFRSALGTSNNGDARAPQRTEQLTSNAWRMFHVFAYDCHRSQSALGLHGIHLAILNLLFKFPIQHTTSLGHLHVTHTYTGTVFRRSLTDHEHRDALIGQTGEDATIDTYHTHHAQTRYRYQTGALDTAYTLDAAHVIHHLTLDDGALGLGVESVLNEYGNVLDTDGIDSRRIDHLGTEVAQFHCLHVS